MLGSIRVANQVSPLSVAATESTGIAPQAGQFPNQRLAAKADHSKAAKPQDFKAGRHSQIGFTVSGGVVAAVPSVGSMGRRFAAVPQFAVLNQASRT